MAKKKKLHVLTVFNYYDDHEVIYYFQSKESVLPFVLKLVRRGRRMTAAVRAELNKASEDMTKCGVYIGRYSYIYGERKFED